MEAKGLSLRFLCDEQILEIPFFQRAYVWNDENWQDLLEDLLRTSGSHFLGSIILKREKKETGMADKAIIIDGQQRLTTLSILVKALYDSISIEDRTNKLINDAIDSLFYTLKSSDSKYLLSINHSYNDRKQFETVIGTVVDGKISSPIIQDLDLIDDKDPAMLVKRCYKFFYTMLKKESNNERIKLWDNLFDKDNKILVVIDLDENDQEQKIFDTINSSGVRLTSTDIIKNALYQKLIEITKNKDLVASYYQETWFKTFEKDDNAVYWNAEKSVGRLMRQNSELFLQAMAIIKGIFDFENHTIQQLADLYKEKIRTFNEQELKDFIGEIVCCAQIYKDHIPDFNGKESFEYNNDDLDAVDQRVAHILDRNDISTFNPYIIYIFKEYAGQDSLIIEKLRELEKYVMGYLITKTPIKNFNKDCITFIKDKAGNEIKKRIKEFNSAQLEGGIAENITNKLGAEILFWIELKRRFDEKKHDMKMLQYNYQLEHIMPQKWEENWNPDIVPYVDEQGNKLPKDEDSKKKRYQKIYSLGNMTLLNGKLNASISNNSFDKKMNGDGKKKGVKDYSSLYITRKDIVEKIYDKQKKWNEQTIIEREKQLGKEVVELWGN